MNQPRIVLLNGPNRPGRGPGLLLRILIAAAAIGVVAVAMFFAFFLAVIAGLAILLLLLRFWFRRWWYGRSIDGNSATTSTSADGTRTWQWSDNGDSGFLKISMRTSVSPNPGHAHHEHLLGQDEPARKTIIDVHPDQT
jgi:hypothetical protein